MSQFPRNFLRPAGDAIILLLALSAANLLIGRSDPGWLQINPAPFLAVPVLIGARYGFLAGFTAGLATVAGILGGRFALIGELPGAIWNTHPFTLAAFPVLGALSGELRRLYATKMRHLEDSNRQYRSSNAKLGLEVDLLRETNRKISQDLALHGTELAAIDVELRDILSSGDAGIFGNTFEFLRRATGVEEAALFSRKGREWTLITSTALSDQSPKFELAEIGTAMAQKACEENDLVTWAGLWGSDQRKDPVGPWLAAMPWAAPGSSKVSSVLMIRTMRLRHATWDNFARITTICRWVSGLAIARLEDTGALKNASPLKAAQFGDLLQLAATTGTEHQLPSALVALHPKSDLDPAAAESEISALLRQTDVFTKSVTAGNPSYTVLLSLAGQRDAAEFLSRLESFSGDIIPVDGSLSAAELLRDISTAKNRSATHTSDKTGGHRALEDRDPSAEPA